MNKREFELLGKVFGAEIDAATGHRAAPVLQTKSKVANKLRGDGLLNFVTLNIPGWPPVKVSGFVLTEVGRYYYCQECGKQSARVNEQ